LTILLRYPLRNHFSFLKINRFISFPPIFRLCYYLLRIIILNKWQEKIMQESKDKLVIIWTSDDRNIALKMVFMYTLNSRLYNWWEDITLIIWGPSAHLISHDHELQEYLKKIKEQGVKLEACITCADMYRVTQDLSDLDIEVKAMGPVLTQYIKEGRNILTF
jgi:hypothetical protein